MEQINNLRDYKKCIAWRAKAGYAEMCYEFCTEIQREHCIKCQEEDNVNNTNNNLEDVIQSITTL